MAGKKTRTRKSKKKIPALATLGAGAYGLNAYNAYKKGGVKFLIWETVGVDQNGKFNMAKFIQNVTPVAAGVGGSMLASKFKVNRYLSGIPLFKL